MKLKIDKRIQIVIVLILLGTSIYLVMPKDNVDKNEEITLKFYDIQWSFSFYDLYLL